MKGNKMNKFKVIRIDTDGSITNHIVEGTDGPKFNGEDGMYKLLNCELIEITGAVKDGKTYDLYLDEEGRYKEFATLNHKATEYFHNSFDPELSVFKEPLIVGTAALVDMEPINE